MPLPESFLPRGAPNASRQAIPSRAPAAAAVLAGAACLSASAILVKLAGVDAATTALLRCAIAVLILVPLALRERARRGPLSGAGIAWALVAGTALGIDYAAWAASIYQVGAGISTVLVNVQVIVLPLLAFLIDGERISAHFLAALPLMLIGISFVGGLWEATASSPQILTGTALGVLAGTGYGCYLFITRRAGRLAPGRVVQPLTWATTAAGVSAAAVSPLSGGIDLGAIPARSWILLAALAVIGQVLAWLFVHHGSARLAPTTTAGLLLIQPVLALGLAAVTLGEHPNGLQLLGVAIVLVSVAIANGIITRTSARP
ncbi:DMT family transporter [Glycomyces sp. A-F 0318]|uniref:DMT family transporter n=1 Tax=Glycomyces amatae TaxID=2881355 RepID=UPI001E3B5DE3|nr:DMT family transporter [Glycomyces amatae]MCD0443650.1 DMT family transporter [Glycomyces amatae]